MHAVNPDWAPHYQGLVLQRIRKGCSRGPHGPVRRGRRRGGEYTSFTNKILLWDFKGCWITLRWLHIVYRFIKASFYINLIYTLYNKAQTQTWCFNILGFFSLISYPSLKSVNFHTVLFWLSSDFYSTIVYSINSVERVLANLLKKHTS